MSEHFFFSDFDSNDVVAFSESNLNKAKRLKEVMSDSLISQVESTVSNHLKHNSIPFPDYVDIICGNGESIRYSNRWTGEGVHCEVLKLGAKEWRKGKIKIRVSVEFYPDEPEVIEEPPSPLDDIRQSMI